MFGAVFFGTKWSENKLNSDVQNYEGLRKEGSIFPDRVGSNSGDII